MATYQYRCENCQLELELEFPMGQAPDTTVHRCENDVFNSMRRVFLPIAVSFKGSGFYRTDSRTTHVRKTVKVGGGE